MRRSNNMPIRVLGGSLVGAVIAILLILLADLFNTTINSGEEISQQYNLPVLGNIPDIVTKKRGKKEAQQ